MLFRSLLITGKGRKSAYLAPTLRPEVQKFLERMNVRSEVMADNTGALIVYIDM